MPASSGKSPRDNRRRLAVPAAAVAVALALATLTRFDPPRRRVDVVVVARRNATAAAARKPPAANYSPPVEIETNAATGWTTSSSPACRPHFRAALPDGKNWTTERKFERLYFYHARKAGGTNLRVYFEKVARHHGLKFAATEYSVAEDPGTHDDATFYVTHLREPVARSISHFKYDIRWNCGQLIDNASFIPTEENAQKLSTWNQHFGQRPSDCSYHKNGTYKPFRMAACAVNCYSQWFAGINCPWWDPPPNPGPEARPIRREVPMTEQYKVAKEKLLRYNLIVVTELLRHKDYVAAIERFLGVPGVAVRATHPWCEPESHYANKKVPLQVERKVLKNLTRLNKIDIGLYHEMHDCLDKGDYEFPPFDPSRFETNETIQLNHTDFVCGRCHDNSKLPRSWLKKFDNVR